MAQFMGIGTSLEELDKIDINERQREYEKVEKSGGGGRNGISPTSYNPVLTDNQQAIMGGGNGGGQMQSQFPFGRDSFDQGINQNQNQNQNGNQDQELYNQQIRELQYRLQQQ